MNRMRVELLGKFQAWRGATVMRQLKSRKAQELLAYLLLYRHRPHPRETLAELLWVESNSTRPREYLRKALWQLQSAMNGQDGPGDGHFLLVDAEWIQINPQADVWCDAGEFEAAWIGARGKAAETLTPEETQRLQKAVALYQGDLLDSWYPDWCLFERERFRQNYIHMVDKLMVYHSGRGEDETAAAYATRLLQQDRANERAHRELMRLYGRHGNRPAALRQFEHCVAALAELGVEPEAETVGLLGQMRGRRSDLRGVQMRPVNGHGNGAARLGTPPLSDVLNRLQEMQTVLTTMQGQVQQSIQVVEMSLGSNGRDLFLPQ